MQNYQYTNPFFMDGVLSAEVGEDTSACPYDYRKYDDEKKIQDEYYRQTEWYAGYWSVKNEKSDS